MNVDLRGRRAVITGGTRGIGAAISRTLALCGAEVIAVYRQDEKSAAALIETICAAGGTARGVRANLVHPEEIRALFAPLDRVDILVHSAAIGSFKPLVDVRPNQWDLTMNVNARAFQLCAVEAARLMPAEGGSILALSSPGSARVVPHYGAIGVSKAALEAAVRALAVELGSRGIHVNALSAGIVEETSIHLHPHHDALRDAALARTPLGRLARPGDIAAIAAFLCSPHARWIQGQTIVADGGMGLGL